MIGAQVRQFYLNCGKPTKDQTMTEKGWDRFKNLWISELVGVGKIQ
jgi:hypothetical protein